MKIYKVAVKMNKDINVEFFVETEDEKTLIADTDFYLEGLTAIVEEVNIITFSNFASIMKDTVKKL